MKKPILVLLLFISALSFSQEVKTIEITSELTQKTKAFFTSYFAEIKAGNWSAIIDHMPEGFTNLMSKDMLVGQMKKAFNNEAFTTTFNKMTYKDIPMAFSYEDVTYANVNYESSFTFHFIQNETQKDDEFNVYVDFMTSTFKNQFKGQNVERKGKDITISGDKVILIIDDPKAGALKMLEFDKNMAEFYKTFIPEAVINTLLK
ncbi:hypothetical protein [Seonamhaeicola marinus]|uniref:DUF3887 domain-containing protein n=1 Tax=Seonamhaeicola marinus TaxID=1912246 RepID=A0A5D0HS75_9FLAO|nr:hypothetical protein [Seonamhaeicola marinus]TYA74194.1 hypothetical protein FUA24_12730 [Seonamhaeicola marinus]